MTTLKSKFEIKGNGLMSGIETVLEVSPSEKKGIRFHINNAIIEANLHNVVSTEHCVVLGDVKSLLQGIPADKIAKVALIEHFMAAAAICDVDSLDAYFKTPSFEMPILDGSSKVWVEKFKEVGTIGEVAPKICLSNPISFIKNKSSVVLIPHDGPTTITYMVNFNHPELKNRWVNLLQNDNLNDIIEARTFGYLKDLEQFQKMGFSKGVTIENTVGLTDDGYTTQLRSEFEPIKHKILDIIGDLYLTGVNPLKLNANIIVKEAGHAIHVEVAKLLKEQL